MVKPKILCNPVRHLCLHGQMTPPTSHTGISAPNWLESLPPIVYFFKSKLNKEKFITDNTHTKRQHVLSWVSLAHFYGSSCTPSFFCASLLPATAPLVSNIYNFGLHLIYRKVASSSLSWLVAHLYCLWRGNLMLMYCDFWPKSQCISIKFPLHKLYENS